MGEGIDAARAFELLGLEQTASEADVKRVYRTLAMTTHPDRVGEGTFGTSRMQELNLAYERALEAVNERVNPKCVCLGFTRNPLCKAHEEPKSEARCARCGDTKRVETGSGFMKLSIDCPDCC